VHARPTGQSGTSHFAARRFVTNPTVVISVTGATSQIRYTLDGTAPATNSPLYAGALTLSNSCYLQARAFATGAPPSEVAAETFTLLERTSPISPRRCRW